jgi:3-dehydroquinate synthase
MLSVRHHAGAYPIEFRSIAEAAESFQEDALWIVDENVLRFHGEHIRTIPIVVASGEASKSLESYRSVVETIADRKTRRHQPIVAFGGGVVGDLAGFVAATYMRGLELIMVPTTLLSMVDSSVGGKVGIDLPQGKNLLGSFYPPVRIDIDLQLLETLPQRQWINGLAEVWKYGFIMDPELIDWMILDPTLDLDRARVIVRCIENKAKVVQDDEFDVGGQRAILNFGHTIGHALEHLTGYGPLLHGEAVAIGMVIEARLGERLGVTTSGVSEFVELQLEQTGLPTTHEMLGQPESILEAMRNDKKMDRQGYAFSLLTKLGECKLVSGVPESDIVAALQTG